MLFINENIMKVLPIVQFELYNKENSFLIQPDLIFGLDISYFLSYLQEYSLFLIFLCIAFLLVDCLIRGKASFSGVIIQKVKKCLRYISKFFLSIASYGNDGEACKPLEELLEFRKKNEGLPTQVRSENGVVDLEFYLNYLKNKLDLLVKDSDAMSDETGKIIKNTIDQVIACYSQMQHEYSLLLVFLSIAILLVIVLIGASYFLAKQSPESEKLSAYECGFEPYEDSRHTFDIKFCLIAILFIVFDIEILFLIPWCVSIAVLDLLSFWAMLDFLIELGVGFFYIWYVKALNWH